MSLSLLKNELEESTCSARPTSGLLQTTSTQLAVVVAAPVPYMSLFSRGLSLLLGRTPKPVRRHDVEGEGKPLVGAHARAVVSAAGGG